MSTITKQVQVWSGVISVLALGACAQIAGIEDSVTEEPGGGGGTGGQTDVGSSSSGSSTGGGMGCNGLNPFPIVGCLQSQADVPACQTSGQVYVKCAGNKTSPFCTYDGNCAAEGCLSRVWFRYDLGQSQSVQHMRYRSDWWNKRPRNWELWASNSAQAVPQNGALLVATGIDMPAPWACVTGEACTDEVPIECCPNGRDKQQDTINVGTTYGKYDQSTFAATDARYWYFVVVDTYDANFLYQLEFALFSEVCSE